MGAQCDRDNLFLFRSFGRQCLVESDTYVIRCGSAMRKGSRIFDGGLRTRCGFGSCERVSDLPMDPSLLLLLFFLLLLLLFASTPSVSDGMFLGVSDRGAGMAGAGARERGRGMW